jgi:hypothetical protein
VEPLTLRIDGSEIIGHTNEDLYEVPYRIGISRDYIWLPSGEKVHVDEKIGKHLAKGSISELKWAKGPKKLSEEDEEEDPTGDIFQACEEVRKPMYPGEADTHLTTEPMLPAETYTQNVESKSYPQEETLWMESDLDEVVGRISQSFREALGELLEKYIYLVNLKKKVSLDERIGDYLDSGSSVILEWVREPDSEVSTLGEDDGKDESSDSTDYLDCLETESLDESVGEALVEPAHLEEVNTPKCEVTVEPARFEEADIPNCETAGEVWHLKEVDTSNCEAVIVPAHLEEVDILNGEAAVEPGHPEREESAVDQIRLEKDTEDAIEAGLRGSEKSEEVFKADRPEKFLPEREASDAGKKKNRARYLRRKAMRQSDKNENRSPEIRAMERFTKQWKKKGRPKNRRTEYQGPVPIRISASSRLVRMARKADAELDVSTIPQLCGRDISGDQYMWQTPY